MQLERVDRLAQPPRQARPGIVEALGALGEAQPGEVQRDRPHPLVGQVGDHLAVQERARRDPVEQDHVRPVALLAHEAAHAAGGKAPPGGAVDVDQLADRGIHGR